MGPQVSFEQGLRDTVDWYRTNEWWWRPIKEQDPAFRSYYQLSTSVEPNTAASARSAPRAPRSLAKAGTENETEA